MWRIIVIVVVSSVGLRAAPAAQAAWPPGADAGFTADVYPSAPSAVRGLAPQLEGLVREVTGGRPVTFYVTGPTGAALTGELTSALRRSFGDAEVFDVVPARKLAGGEVHIDLQARRDATYTVPGVGETHGGAVVLAIRGARGERECAARFTDKPWLTDLDQFKSGRPGRWVIGQADEPSATRDGAATHAIGRAVAEIMPLLAAEAGCGPADAPFAAPRVSAALSSGRLVADRFACRFERPYGDVFHEAILVDASPANLKAIAAEAAQARRAAVRSKLNTGGSIVGLVVTIGLIYALTNFLTKGYFAGRLRALALLALVAGAAAVVALLA